MCDLFSLAENAVFQVHRKGLETLGEDSLHRFFLFPECFRPNKELIVHQKSCCRCCASEFVGSYVGYGMRKELFRKLSFVCPFAKKHCQNLFRQDYKPKMPSLASCYFHFKDQDFLQETCRLKLSAETRVVLTIRKPCLMMQVL